MGNPQGTGQPPCLSLNLVTLLFQNQTVSIAPFPSTAHCLRMMVVKVKSDAMKNKVAEEPGMLLKDP